MAYNVEALCLYLSAISSLGFSSPSTSFSTSLIEFQPEL